MNQTAEPSTQPVTEAIIERVCPQCGSSSFGQHSVYSKDEWRVGDCGDCGFTYLQNVPVYDRLIDEFAWEKSRPAETARRYRERPVTARLSMAFRRARKPFRASEQDLFARLFKPGPVLDVGCGNGERIPPMFTPYGIELSKQLCENANGRMKPRGGYVVHAPAVEGIGEFEPRFFTGIILRSFLEHEWHRIDLLGGGHMVLRDDGGVLIRVANFWSTNRKVRGAQWCGFRYPDHVNYFTPQSLSNMAADCGFNMRLLNPIKISIDDNIKAVLTKRTA